MASNSKDKNKRGSVICWGEIKCLWHDLVELITAQKNVEEKDDDEEEDNDVTHEEVQQVQCPIANTKAMFILTNV